MADHPRTRGVYALTGLAVSTDVGSSPHARGLPKMSTLRPIPLRIIPARAGFTPRDTPSVTPKGDHPRTRGVYAMEAGEISADEGSSPHARGLLVCCRPDGAQEGIIPARAGFTLRRSRSQLLSWDHPRTRGVYPWPVPAGS